MEAGARGAQDRGRAHHHEQQLPRRDEPQRRGHQGQVRGAGGHQGHGQVETHRRHRPAGLQGARAQRGGQALEGGAARPEAHHGEVLQRVPFDPHLQQRQQGARRCPLAMPPRPSRRAVHRVGREARDGHRAAGEARDAPGARG